MSGKSAADTIRSPQPAAGFHKRLLGDSAVLAGWIASFVQWTVMHPHLAGLLVASTACAESLAFIGLVVPGSVMMLGAGALIGVGALGFWSTVAWAVAGSMLGDGLSYGLGRHYRDRLDAIRWVRSHPELLARAETFFKDHGAKSVLMARFVGPIRPLLPVTAGMAGMRPGRFYPYDAVAAVAWALAHLIPGMVFGASLAIAGQVAGRLTLLLGAVMLTAWAVAWTVRTAYLRLAPRAGNWVRAALDWQLKHPRLAWLVGDLIDPRRPVSRPLLLWLCLLTAGIWLFFGVLEDVVTLDPLVYAGQSFYHFLQQVRTPLGDRTMTVLTELGDAAVTVPVTAAVLGWLLMQKAWRDALYWLAAVGFAALAVAAIKLAVHVPRPTALYAGLDAYSFPSGHTTVSTVVYGFLAALSAGSMSPRRRWIPYALAALLVTAIGFSRLYLGAHWLADVAGGVGLGSAWVAVLAIARTRHSGGPRQHPGLALTAVTVFAAAAGWHVHASLNADLQRYATRTPVRLVEVNQWWRSQWKTLAAYRVNMEGEKEQPLNVQWAGDLAGLRRMLAAQGWRAPLPFTLGNVLHCLLPHPTLGELPVTPQLHNGRYAALVLVHPGDGSEHTERQLILRMWPTAAHLTNSGAPVWIGTVGWQQIRHLPLVSFPHDAGRYDEALGRLTLALQTLRWKLVRRAASANGNTPAWSGNTLLVTWSPRGPLPPAPDMLVDVPSEPLRGSS